jgi:hypothetical protein
VIVLAPDSKADQKALWYLAIKLVVIFKSFQKKLIKTGRDTILTVRTLEEDLAFIV